MVCEPPVSFPYTVIVVETLDVNAGLGVNENPNRSLQVFGYRSITFYGLSFQTIHLTIQVPQRGPTTPLRAYVCSFASIFG
jgi:hypothetical protein